MSAFFSKFHQFTFITYCKSLGKRVIYNHHIFLPKAPCPSGAGVEMACVLRRTLTDKLPFSCRHTNTSLCQQAITCCRNGNNLLHSKLISAFWENKNKNLCILIFCFKHCYSDWNAPESTIISSWQYQYTTLQHQHLGKDRNLISD